MGFRDWWKWRNAAAEDPRLGRWREDWRRVAESAERTEIMRLASALNALGLPEEDVEIEREMLQALEEQEELSAAFRAAGLPRIETGHRVVRAEPCHYTAPASMPDEPGQPAGRLLLTGGRVIFVGARGIAAAWHTIAMALHADRDVVLVKHDRESYRFRCNTYGDAMRATFIAGKILASRRQGSSSL